jgi:TonB family protein
LGVQVLESGSYRNGQRDGNWDYYYNVPVENTKNTIKERGAYVDGRKNGVWIAYYPDTIPEITNTRNFGTRRKIDSITISINQQSAKINMAGMYLNDKRVGEWTSFTYSGGIFQKYNFSQKLLIRDPSVKDSTEYNRNRNALFVGGLPCLDLFLSFEFNWMGVAPALKEDSTSVIVSFKIDREGNSLEPKIAKSTGNKRFEDEAIRVVTLTDKKWIPAVVEFTPIDSYYRIHFYILQEKVSSSLKKYKLGFDPVIERAF